MLKAGKKNTHFFSFHKSSQTWYLVVNGSWYSTYVNSIRKSAEFKFKGSTEPKIYSSEFPPNHPPPNISTALWQWLTGDRSCDCGSVGVDPFCCGGYLFIIFLIFFLEPMIFFTKNCLQFFLKLPSSTPRVPVPQLNHSYRWYSSIKNSVSGRVLC